jgi:hypothetical protein
VYRTTTEADVTERTNGASDDPRDEPRDGTSDGDEPSDEPRGHFDARTDYKPDDLVTIKIRYAERQEFNAWHRSQFPGVKMLPARDEWSARVFKIGLDRMKELMPAQPSPDERWKAATGTKP